MRVQHSVLTIRKNIMTNRNQLQTKAIQANISEAELVAKQKKDARREKAAGRAHIAGAVEALANAGVDPSHAVPALSWDEAVLGAKHEQLHADASDIYHAANDAYFRMLTHWSDMRATVSYFGSSPDTPPQWNWDFLIDPITGAPAYGAGGPLFGFDTMDEADDHREAMADLRTAMISPLWNYLKDKTAKNGVHLSPLKENGDYGDHTNVALLVKIGDMHYQVFAYQNDDCPNRWYIERIDEGDVVDSNGDLTWDDEYDLTIMHDYARISALHWKADKKQKDISEATKQQDRINKVIARQIARKEKGKAARPPR